MTSVFSEDTNLYTLSQTSSTIRLVGLAIDGSGLTEVELLVNQLSSNSLLFRDILSSCNDNEVVNFPVQYNDVFEVHVAYLQWMTSEVVSDTNILKRCLQLYHYLDDSELQYDIYLNTPYQLLTEAQFADHDLFKHWLEFNRDRKFDLGCGNSSHSNSSYMQYSHQLQVDSDTNTVVLFYSDTADTADVVGKYQIHGVVRCWYESGRFKSLLPHRHGKRVGLHLEYADDDNNTLIYEANYEDDQKHGVTMYWSVGASESNESAGANNLANPTGKLKFCHNYYYGNKDGWQLGYYPNGKLKYRIHYGQRYEFNLYDESGKRIAKPTKSQRKNCQYK